MDEDQVVLQLFDTVLRRAELVLEATSEACPEGASVRLLSAIAAATALAMASNVSEDVLLRDVRFFLRLAQRAHAREQN